MSTLGAVAYDEELADRIRALIAQEPALSSADVRTKPQLAKWVTRGATFARSLPAKR